ncbi:MAG: YdbL family protein [Gammaproteobacteria bacterium]
MRRVLPLKLLFAVLLAACVTVNVYFPAAAAEKAADQIIDTVTGQGSNQGANTAPKPQGSTVQPPGLGEGVEPAATERTNVLLVAAGNLLYLLVPAANAQGAANLDVNTPEIRAVTGSMQSRFGQLKAFFDSGAVGLTADGHVELRDANAVPLAERANAKRLVAEENRDRDALYGEIAKANGHPEWKSDIQTTFARRWIERAPGGTYYQDAGGGWKQK